MRLDSIAALVTAAVFAAAVTAPQAELYIDLQPNGKNVVDVVIGNRGTAVSRENFDAWLDVANKDKSQCRCTTNFITPIAPGESIRALRLEITSDAASTRQLWAVRASARFWDHNRRELRKDALILLRTGTARCIALKPMQ